MSGMVGNGFVADPKRAPASERSRSFLRVCERRKTVKFEGRDPRTRVSSLEKLELWKSQKLCPVSIRENSLMIDRVYLPIPVGLVRAVSTSMAMFMGWLRFENDYYIP